MERADRSECLFCDEPVSVLKDTDIIMEGRLTPVHEDCRRIARMVEVSRMASNIIDIRYWVKRKRQEKEQSVAEVKHE